MGKSERVEIQHLIRVGDFFVSKCDYAHVELSNKEFYAKKFIEDDYDRAVTLAKRLGGKVLTKSVTTIVEDIEFKEEK